MNNSIVAFIATRYWRIKGADSFGRMVSTLSITGIIIGVTALIIVLSIMNGLEHHQKQRLLTTIPHALVTKKDLSPFTEKDIQHFPHNDLIKKIAPINTSNIIIQSPLAITAGKLLGISSSTNAENLSHLSPATLKQLLPTKSYNIILSQYTMNALQVNIGDKIRVLITENSRYTPFGRIPVQRLFTVIDSFIADNDVDAMQSYANIDDIGRLNYIKPETTGAVQLWLKDPFQINKLTYPDSEFKIEDWRTQKGEFFQAVKMEKNIMGLLISLIIIVAISNIITSLSLMVLDKQAEIAILLTQGLSRHKLMYIFMLQGLLIGAFGTSIGIASGLLISYHLDPIMNILQIFNFSFPIIVNYHQIIVITLASLLCSFIATLYPAYRAAAIDPAETLRYE